MIWRERKRRSWSLSFFLCCVEAIPKNAYLHRTCEYHSILVEEPSPHSDNCRCWRAAICATITNFEFYQNHVAIAYARGILIVESLIPLDWERSSPFAYHKTFLDLALRLQLGTITIMLSSRVFSLLGRCNHWYVQYSSNASNPTYWARMKSGVSGSTADSIPSLSFPVTGLESLDCPAFLPLTSLMGMVAPRLEQSIPIPQTSRSWTWIWSPWIWLWLWQQLERWNGPNYIC